MNGVEYRMRDFIRPRDGHSLVVDTSAGIALGALPGLEDFTKAITPLLEMMDGLVCSPGQIKKLPMRKKEGAGILVRVDWTNAWRRNDFVLPPNEISLILLLTAQETLDLGAVGMVSTFLLGFNESIDAACLRNTVHLALEGKKVGMPLVVDVQTCGPGISLPGKAVELGISYALEGGADAIVFPYPGEESLHTIAAFVSVPWFVKISDLNLATSLINEILELGGVGIWLDHHLFRTPNPEEVLVSVGARIHI